MPKYASLAEQYRMHREAFGLALELGCTPRQAEQMLRDRARARRRACGTLLRQAQAERPNDDLDFEPLDRRSADPSDWHCFHMMRD